MDWRIPKHLFSTQKFFLVLLKTYKVFCYNFKFSNPFIFKTRWFILFIFQTYIIWTNKIHSLKYLRHWVAKIQSLWLRLKFLKRERVLGYFLYHRLTDLNLLCWFIWSVSSPKCKILQLFLQVGPGDLYMDLSLEPTPESSQEVESEQESSSQLHLELEKSRPMIER